MERRVLAVFVTLAVASPVPGEHGVVGSQGGAVVAPPPRRDQRAPVSDDRPARGGRGENVKKTQPVSLGSGQKSPLDFLPQGEGILLFVARPMLGVASVTGFLPAAPLGLTWGGSSNVWGGPGPEIAVQAGLGCVSERATREIGVTEQQRNANKSRNASYGSVRSERREEEKMKKVWKMNEKGQETSGGGGSRVILCEIPRYLRLPVCHLPVRPFHTLSSTPPLCLPQLPANPVSPAWSRRMIRLLISSFLVPLSCNSSRCFPMSFPVGGCWPQSGRGEPNRCLAFFKYSGHFSTTIHSIVQPLSPRTLFYPAGDQLRLCDSAIAFVICPLPISKL